MTIRGRTGAVCKNHEGREDPLTETVSVAFPLASNEKPCDCLWGGGRAEGGVRLFIFQSCLCHLTAELSNTNTQITPFALLLMPMIAVANFQLRFPFIRVLTEQMNDFLYNDAALVLVNKLTFQRCFVLSKADGFMNRDQNKPGIRGEDCLPEQRTSLWARESERTSTHNNMRSHTRGQQNMTAKKIYI